MTDLSAIKALTFDVYGTCVDVRGSLLRELPKVHSRLDSEFVDAWIRAYARGFREDYRPCDELLGEASEQLLQERGIGLLFNNLHRYWRILQPWPDVIPGLAKIRAAKLTVAALTNASKESLGELCAFKKLPFNPMLSADFCKAFKPDPKIYQMALDSLCRRPHEVMMVASHKFDLVAAAKMGFRTAFVPRPYEWGGEWEADKLEPGDSFDVVADSFIDLAAQLGAP